MRHLKKCVAIVEDSHTLFLYKRVVFKLKMHEQNKHVFSLEKYLL